jgi:hypothetical protein
MSLIFSKEITLLERKDTLKFSPKRLHYLKPKILNILFLPNRTKRNELKTLTPNLYMLMASKKSLRLEISRITRIGRNVIPTREGAIFQ